jgi:hypothetical protein
MRLIIVLAVSAVAVSRADLQPATLAAFEKYVSATERRIAGERSGSAASFWLDQQPERARATAWARLKRGEVVVESLQTRDAGSAIPIPGGRVHHWVATTLLPGVSPDRVVSFVRDYDKYPTVFTPLMTRSSVRERGDMRDVVALRTSIRKIINVVMQGDYVMEYRRLGNGRVATTTVATNLHQVHNEGRADERLQPTDQTSGYLWRYRMYCIVEQRPEGALDQCESLTLTRTVPAIASWFIGGSVAAIPRDSLVLMLAGTRKALVN